MGSKFNTNLSDSQATKVTPILSEHFNLEDYADYTQHLMNTCQKFWQAESGVLVYRRMRVGEVFSYGSKDMKHSLACQLGGLYKSMEFKTDIPNFLEPWYGIGTIASAFGRDYIWPENQAPAITSCFNSSKEALDYQPEKVENTRIGQHTLKMIEHFLDKTKGKVPISLTDTQSPFNIAFNIIDTTHLMLDILANPEQVRSILDRIAILAIEFTSKQLELLRDVIVWPGHGFPSSTQFNGIGMSDDNILMISGDQYLKICAQSIEKFGSAFAGTAFHSCGNWSTRIKFVRQIHNQKMVDGAFSEETDPSPNPTSGFEEFAYSGIIVNARIVGNVETIIEKVKSLWNPGMKMIVTTYCRSPEEQEEAYDRIHEICQS
jgi:hypothetical protein